MKNTQLEDMTDAELSEAFALEVAEWVRVPDGYGMGDIYCEAANLNRSHGPVEKHRFATSADDVLLWLEKHEDVDVVRDKQTVGLIWSIAIWKYKNGISNGVVGKSASFARAAAIALIKAKRNAT